MKFTMLSSLLLILLSFSMMSPLTHADLTPDAVVGIWLFDEGNGKIARDVSPKGGHDGQLIGDVRWVDGRFGMAIEVGPGDPAWNRVTVQHQDDMDLVEFTISAWVKVPELSGICCNMIVSKENFPAGGFRNYSMFMRPTVMVGFTVMEPFGDIEVGSIEITDNEWHHTVGTYDGKNLMMYVDGVAYPPRVFDRKAEQRNPASTGEENMHIGAMGPSGERFGIKGLIDDVALFSTGMTQKEVESLMEKGLTGLTNELGLSLVVDPRGKLATTWATLKTQ